jgi:RNA polymerase sigma-70 factor (ECF subfamily)
MTSQNAGHEELISLAKSGDEESCGKLLDLYRNYLLLLARTQIDMKLRVRIDASDVVQETFMDAHRAFADFNGATEPELTAWLRRILIRNLIDTARHHGAQCRDWHLDKSIEANIDESNQHISHALGISTSTPSIVAIRREQSVVLADAIAELPADYREVLIQRQIYQREFGSIAESMGKSSGAVRMLWVRALEKLRLVLDDIDHDV